MVNSSWQLINKGSVKDVYSHGGDYIFDYSDRYSIFDWGEMPDKLNNKGKSLAVMAHLFFKYFGKPDLWQDIDRKKITLNSDILELLQKQGLSHHSQGLINDRGNDLNSEKAQTFLKIEPVEIHRPVFENNKYDYSFYKTRPIGSLVPLEVIFRFGMPKGSSLLRRLKKKPSYLKDIGLINMPKEGDIFDKPIIEFSTKLEASDTYLSKEQAFKIAGLNAIEANRLCDLAILMALKLKNIFEKMELELWDGKFEFAFKKGCSKGRNFLWVDSMGPDEVRLLKDGAQLSKEFLRQAYINSEWLETVKQEKSKDKNNFKENVLKKIPSGPPTLPLPYIETAENIYTTLTNSLCNVLGEPEVFHHQMTVADLAKQIKRVNK